MTDPQCASSFLMIRPKHFGFNTETSATNKFQKSGEIETGKVLAEFDNVYHELTAHGLDVMVIDDREDIVTPDSVFSNNWLHIDHQGNIFIFPLMAQNRRIEKRDDVVDAIVSKFAIEKIEDWSRYEKEGSFLESTGSMVFDHANRIAYASISARTDEQLFLKFCGYNNYKPVTFRTFDNAGFEVYHTNVIMSVGDEFCVLCDECFLNASECELVKFNLKSCGKHIIVISQSQMENYCANILQVQNKFGEKFMVMSHRAFNHFTLQQISELEKYGKLMVCNIENIEAHGGGSIRCMMTEIFAKRK